MSSKNEKWQFKFNDSILNDKFGPVLVGARRNGRGLWRGTHSFPLPLHVQQFLLVTENGGRWHYAGVKSTAEIKQQIVEAGTPVKWHKRISGLCGTVEIEKPVAMKGYIRRHIPRDTPAIRNLSQLCRYFGADSPQGLNRRIYKDTECGASISVQTPDLKWHHNGQDWSEVKEIVAFTIQTIVEGSDATVDSEPFVLPVPEKEIEDWIAEMESESNALWYAANEVQHP